MGFLAPENLSWGCPASGIYQGVGKQSETPARDIFGGVYKAQTLAGGEASGTGRGEGATQGQFSPRAEPERPGFWARDSSRRVWNQRGSGSRSEWREGSSWAESVLSPSPRGALGCGWYHGTFFSYPSISRSLAVGHRGGPAGGRRNLTCISGHSSSRWSFPKERRSCGPLAANKPRSWGQLCCSPDKGDLSQGGGRGEPPVASTAEPKVSGDR